MKNYVQSGQVVALTAPYDVASGAGAKVGVAFCVATGAVASGAAGEFATMGVFDLKAAGAATASQGGAAYWDDTNKEVNATPSGNTKIGVFLDAKTNGQTKARVRLNGSF